MAEPLRFNTIVVVGLAMPSVTAVMVILVELNPLDEVELLSFGGLDPVVWQHVASSVPSPCLAATPYARRQKGRLARSAPHPVAGQLYVLYSASARITTARGSIPSVKNPHRTHLAGAAGDDVLHAQD